jgi:TonB family protein
MGLAASLLIHVALAAVIVFWPSGGFERQDLFVPTYNVRLVGAPQPAPAPAPAAAQPAAKPQPKAEPAPKPKPVAKPKPTPKPKEAIATKKRVAKPKKVRPKAKADTPKVDENLLKKRLARIQAQVATERRMDSAINRLERRVAGRGGGAQGVAPVAGADGGGGGKTSSVLDAYYNQIWERVRGHWILPEAMLKGARGLVTVLVVRIRRDGSLEKVWVEKSSGNQRYDQTALRAARRASPFPRLPGVLRQSSHEVGLRFRAEDINT